MLNLIVFTPKFQIMIKRNTINFVSLLRVGLVQMPHLSLYKYGLSNDTTILYLINRIYLPTEIYNVSTK